MDNIRELPQEIPYLIRLHRKKTGLSQHELAKLAGVGKTVVFDLEHGKMSVQLDTLIRVLNALNIKIHLSSPLLQAIKEKEA